MASEYHDRIASQLTYARQALLDSPAYKCRGLLYRSSGVATLISVASLLLLFALVLHATLPSRSASVSFLRFLCWPLTLFILWPIVQDRGEKYTLGNDFRDIAIPAFAWLPLSEMTRVCFVSLWDSYEDRAPRWIVPLSQAHKWGITGDVAQEKEQRVTPTYGSAAAHHKHDVDDDNSAGRGKYAKEGSIPSQWVVVPHAPFFSWRRFLWAIDNMTLRRPGTSFLFPAQQRSLEWSLPVLRKTSGIYAESEAQKYTQDDDFIRSHSPVWFGVSEWGFIYSAFHMAFLVQFYRFITLLDLSIQKGTYHPVDFYGLPLHMQYFLTFGLGALVVFPTSSIDCIIHFVLKQVLRWPVTAICPAFQRPLFASGPTDFWNRRWHQFLRRDFSAIAKLVPGSRESGIVRLVATFAVSGAEHSFVFSRFLRKPPTILHAVWLFLHPAFQAFFVSQALLIVIERFCLGGNTRKDTWISALARRALLWVGLLTTGRYVTAHLWSLGCFDAVEFSNWSESRRILSEMWEDVTT